MKLGYNLALEQVQKLVMTPELRQAIKLLQFTSQELSQYIKQEIERNPMLETVGDEIEYENIDDYNTDKEEFDWKEFVEGYDDISYIPEFNKDNKEYDYENIIKHSSSLKEHLLFQLNVSSLANIDLNIGKAIIDNIDDNGYLSVDLEQIADELRIPTARAQKVLSTVQTFDPPGVGSRNLTECLLIQVREDKVDNPKVELIIKNHLEDLAYNRLHKVSKQLNIDLVEVQKIYDYIKTLEPKPGRAFGGHVGNTKYIIPDVNIELVDGEYVIILNDITAPRLNISKYYREMIRKGIDSEASEFLKEKLSQALWIIRSIEQRRMTIYNVVKSILKFQKEFFEKGDKALRPLTLKEVADDINMHESTVSRAINGKYVQTPRGLYELKYFFSGGYSTNRGQEISSTSIKIMIKEIIEEENPRKPLSDQKISEILKKKGIDISRRTVAKYRDEQGIPSSSMRRRYQ